MNTETMFKAYLTAVYFTDTGDNEQPEERAELTPQFKARAYLDCRNFLYAIRESNSFDCVNPEQLGHDLWLTRNRHGAGFWDRTEMYGTSDAEFFTRLSEAMGEHDSEFMTEGETA